MCCQGSISSKEMIPWPSMFPHCCCQCNVSFDCIVRQPGKDLKERHCSFFWSCSKSRTRRARRAQETDVVSAFLLKVRCYGIALLHKTERKQCTTENQVAKWKGSLHVSSLCLFMGRAPRGFPTVCSRRNEPQVASFCRKTVGQHAVLVSMLLWYRSP